MIRRRTATSPRALALAILALAVAACGAPPVAAPRASGATGASPATSPSAFPTGPADAAPEAVIDAFLAFARSPRQSFRAAITGEYRVGSHVITYDLAGLRSGADSLESGTETIDGQAVPFGTGWYGGRLYDVTAAGAWKAIAAAPAPSPLTAP